MSEGVPEPCSRWPTCDAFDEDNCAWPDCSPTPALPARATQHSEETTK